MGLKFHLHFMKISSDLISSLHALTHFSFSFLVYETSHYFSKEKHVHLIPAHFRTCFHTMEK